MPSSNTSASSKQVAHCGQVSGERLTMYKGLKRVRDDILYDPSFRPYKKPKPWEPTCGPRPIMIMHISWDGKEPIPVRCLFDTGSTSFVISLSVVQKWNIPFALREEKVPMVNFDGEISEGGEQYTYPITMINKDYYDTETFEVCKMDPAADLIIPWWYLAKHKPSKEFWDTPPSIDFRSDYCRWNCTKHNSAKFTIEYDKTMLLEANSKEEIGIIGAI